jgi:Uma2 family endonuclease
VLEYDFGTISGADAGYIVSGERYIPDVSFVSKAHNSEGDDVAYYPLAPDLAVEVLSPTNTDEEIRVKVSNYLAAGTVLWVVAPGKRVEVHRPGQPVQILGTDDILDGGDLLPGFQLSVREILNI